MEVLANFMYFVSAGYLLFLLLLMKAKLTQSLGSRGSKRELSDLGWDVNTLLQSPLDYPG